MSKEQEALAALLDALDAGIVQARRILKETPPQNQDPRQTPKPENGKEDKKSFEYDPEQIVWAPATGNKGPYQLAASSANADNVNFGLLTSALEDNGKPIWGKQHLYWKLDNNSIGRKPISEVRRRSKA